MAEPTLKTLYKLILVECGDQGGVVGESMRFFPSRNVARAWYIHQRGALTAEGRDLVILEEGEFKALVLADGKTAYEIRHGPLRITQ